MTDRNDVTIYSDGFGGRGTKIVTDDGEILPNVRSISLEINAGEFVEATIWVQHLKIEVQGKITTVYYECPCCSQVMAHKCDVPDDPTPQTVSYPAVPLPVPSPIMAPAGSQCNSPRPGYPATKCLLAFSHSGMHWNSVLPTTPPSTRLSPFWS